MRQKPSIIARPSTPETAILITPLLHYRLRWYASATARLLLRRWQALVLASGLLASADATVFENIAILNHPLLALLNPGHGAIWRFGYLLALQGVAVLWALMQREQIEGGGFMAFVGSLPFSPKERRQVDLAVLLLADSPLLLMVAGSLSVSAARPHALAPLLLCCVALLALVAQVAALERRRGGWAGVALGCALLAAGFGTGFAAAVDALAGLAALLALGIAPWPAWPAAARRRRLPLAAWTNRPLRILAGRQAPALQVSLAILLHERRGEALAKALSAAAVIAAALALMALFDYDGRALGVALLAQGAIALNMSGMFRALRMAHAASRGYTASLPLKAGWWRAFDLAAVLGFALPFLAVPALAAWHMAGLAPGHALAALASYLVLLAALRALQLFSERHAVVLSAILAGSWTVATIACLN